jgi:hypothetical protein
MHWDVRIADYVRDTKFPRSLFVAEDGRVVGTWIMGNDYRVKSSYYGGYPAAIFAASSRYFLTSAESCIYSVVRSIWPNSLATR